MIDNSMLKIYRKINTIYLQDLFIISALTIIFTDIFKKTSKKLCPFILCAFWGGNMSRSSTSCLKAFGWRQLRRNGTYDLYELSRLPIHHFISLFICFIINLYNYLIYLRKLLILLIWLKSKEENQTPNKK